MSPAGLRSREAASDRSPSAKRQDAAATPTACRPRVSGLERWLAQRMLRAMGSPPVRLVLWNGEEFAGSAAPPAARVRLRDRATFWKVLLDPNLQFGDAYSDGRLEVEGDLVALLETIYRSRAAAGRSGSLVPSALLRRLHRARANTLSGARENIHHHYDIGDDFYRLWLDDEMVYSGAYFAEPAMTLDEAQRAKLDYVCRKLWLRPGETCGRDRRRLGGLALLMARDYGVTVKSFNISQPQSLLPAAGRRPKGSTPASSSSRTTTATSPAGSTPWCRWACWSTSARPTTASSAAWPTAALARPAAG